ncbi:sugar phosphate isomerase/epimerase, partial [Salmonella enterica subsp. enterica serovar Enteritidis]|nr:sugar phosphate isomerase/epimerase [Salmonella enterica subsp. enterica serovar Enteritidis]
MTVFSFRSVVFTMKIAFDVDVIKHLPITQMVRQVS